MNLRVCPLLQALRASKMLLGSLGDVTLLTRRFPSWWFTFICSLGPSEGRRTGTRRHQEHLVLHRLGGWGVS